MPAAGGPGSGCPSAPSSPYAYGPASSLATGSPALITARLKCSHGSSRGVGGAPGDSGGAAPPLVRGPARLIGGRGRPVSPVNMWTRRLRIASLYWRDDNCGPHRLRLQDPHPSIHCPGLALGLFFWFADSAG